MTKTKETQETSPFGLYQDEALAEIPKLILELQHMQKLRQKEIAHKATPTELEQLETLQLQHRDRFLEIAQLAYAAQTEIDIHGETDPYVTHNIVQANLTEIMRSIESTLY